jgi:hypothetical protein
LQPLSNAGRLKEDEIPVRRSSSPRSDGGTSPGRGGL